MGRIAFTLIGAAGLGAVLGSATITLPANAALVIPNGSFSYSLPGSNSVDTTNITSDTSQLRLDIPPKKPSRRPRENFSSFSRLPTSTSQTKS